MKTLSLSYPHPAMTCTALAWDPTGERLSGVYDNGTVMVWDVCSGRPIFCHRLTRTRLLTVSWSLHGQCLAIGGDNHFLTMIAVQDGTRILSHSFEAPVHKVLSAPRGERFLLASGSQISVYTGRRGPFTLAYASPVLDVSWSPTGGRFALVGDERVCVYNVLRRRYASTLRSVAAPRCVAWSPNGCDLAIGTAHGMLHLYDLRHRVWYRSVQVSSSPLVSLAWGRRCLVASDAQADVTLWQMTPPFAVLRQYPVTRPLFALSPLGTQIALALPHQVCVVPA